jgi:hypothetical protein
MRCRIKPTTPSCGAKQNHLLRTNRRPFAPKASQPIPSALIQSPVGTKHLSPAWQRWGKIRPLQKAPRGRHNSSGQSAHRNNARLTLTEAARAQAARPTLAESALTFFQGFKSFRMCTYKKEGEGYRRERLFSDKAFRGKQSQELRGAHKAFVPRQTPWNHILVRIIAATPMESYPCKKRWGARVHEALL